MDPNERLPEDLHRIDAALGELRSEVTAHDLDALSQRIRRGRVRAPRGIRPWRRPGLVAALLSAGVLLFGAAGTLALTGEFSSTSSSGSAQYVPAPAAVVSAAGTTIKKATKKVHATVCRRTHRHRARTKAGRRAQAARARRLCASAKHTKKHHTRRR